MTKRTKHSWALALAVLLSACSKTYYALPGLDHGLVQSPVNILSSEVRPQEHDVILTNEKGEAQTVVNNGYTIELEFPSGVWIVFDGIEYALKQVHFHTPSEHQIDGMTFPMEIHAVHMHEALDPKKPPEYLVIAVLFRMGTSSSFIGGFLDLVPPKKGKEVDIRARHVYLEDLLPTDPKVPYYHYRGSLTTRPYTETVQWLVLKEIFEASPAQIRRINELEGDNARHVQALYGREID